MEHLSTSVTDGTIDKLRELAGGQRKVGAYLSSVVEWLWWNREAWIGHTLSEYDPMTPELIRQVTERDKSLDAQMREDMDRVISSVNVLMAAYSKLTSEDNERISEIITKMDPPLPRDRGALRPDK
jgi:hypothetical protein